MTGPRGQADDDALAAWGDWLAQTTAFLTQPLERPATAAVTDPTAPNASACGCPAPPRRFGGEVVWCPVHGWRDEWPEPADPDATDATL